MITMMCLYAWTVLVSNLALNTAGRIFYHIQRVSNNDFLILLFKVLDDKSQPAAINIVMNVMIYGSSCIWYMWLMKQRTVENVSVYFSVELVPFHENIRPRPIRFNSIAEERKVHYFLTLRISSLQNQSVAPLSSSMRKVPALMVKSTTWTPGISWRLLR